MKNYTITVNGNVYDVVVEEGSTSGVTSVPKAAPVARKAPVAAKAAAPKASGAAGSVEVKSGTAGKVYKVEVEVGQIVKNGDTIVVVEAMKMEIPVVATQDGTVASVDVSEGQAIEAGTLLATLN